jgi:hypothetical protein
MKVHIKNLLLYVRLGCVVTKVHRGYTFDEQPFMEKWVRLNMELRKTAKKTKDKSSEELFKLMINAVFGKSCENTRRRTDCKMVRSKEQLLKCQRKRTYLSHIVLASNAVELRVKKAKVEMKKPIYLGFSILELSKLRMFEFHYLYMKRHFLDRIKVRLTDTDSLVYSIEAPKGWDKSKHGDWSTLKEIYQTKGSVVDVHSQFDFSTLDESSPYYDCSKKGEYGVFKEEIGWAKILELICIKPKMYMFDCDWSTNVSREKRDGKDNFRAKGMKLRQCPVSIDDYRNTVLNSKCTSTKITTFRKEVQSGAKALYRKYLDEDGCIKKSSRKVDCTKDEKNIKYGMTTIEVEKVGFSPYDDKRYWLPTGIESLAYGHYKIDGLKNLEQFEKQNDQIYCLE